MVVRACVHAMLPPLLQVRWYRSSLSRPSPCWFGAPRLWLPLGCVAITPVVYLILHVLCLLFCHLVDDVRKCSDDGEAEAVSMSVIVARTRLPRDCSATSRHPSFSTSPVRPLRLNAPKVEDCQETQAPEDGRHRCGWDGPRSRSAGAAIGTARSASSTTDVLVG
eukprot:4845742-Amphidinium_carterae.2